MRSHDRTLIASLGFADPDVGNQDHDLACAYLATPERVEALARIVFGPGWSEEASEANARYSMAFNLSVPDRCACGKYADAGQATRVEREGERFVVQDVAMERAVSKGEGQYKTTVGFLDVWGEVVREYERAQVLAEFNRVDADGRPRYVHCEAAEAKLRRDAVGKGGSEGPWRVGSWWLPLKAPGIFDDGRRRVFVAVEVKGRPVPVSTILKQVALYREYVVGQGHDHGVARPVCWFLAACYPLPGRDADALRAHAITPVQLGAKFHAWRDSALTSATSAHDPTEEV